MNRESNSSWELDGEQATLHSPSLSASLNLSSLSSGLRPSEVRLPSRGAQHTIDQHCFGVQHAEAYESVDRYVRGADLVATYSSDGGRLRPQFYWRALFDKAVPACGIEFMVSIDTVSLDMDPSTNVETLLKASEVLWAVSGSNADYERIELGAPTHVDSGERASLLLFRLGESAISYAEMAHPADVSAAMIESGKGDTTMLRWSLFSERLEKGVIRRGRLRGMFIPREEDTERAAHLYREFVASPPPLTT